MASIKIQSLRDVARVYLQTFGYPTDGVSEDGVSCLLDALEMKTDTAEEFVGKADAFIAGIASSVFPSSSDDGFAEAARFKLTFSMADGAHSCPVEKLVRGQLPEDLRERMRAGAVINAPPYRYESMKPQTIDEPHWLSRLFSRFQKG